MIWLVDVGCMVGFEVGMLNDDSAGIDDVGIDDVGIDVGIAVGNDVGIMEGSGVGNEVGTVAGLTVLSAGLVLG